MNKKCIGCGVELQDNNVLLEGYTHDLSNDLCRRCFRMKNYGEYEFITKSNSEYIQVLKNIGTKKSLVLYIVDLISIPYDLSKIKEYLIHNDIILVLNKKDALPLSIKEEKIIEYFKKQNLGFIDTIIISASKNYNIDKLMKLIKKHRTNQNVYVVGNTNAGKSTLINKIINNYTEEDKEFITISPMPSTTLNEIQIKVLDFYLIDTPGLVDEGNVLNYVTEKQVKKISPKKEIKPRTYQIKKGHAIMIDDIFRIDYVEGDKNSFTFYISNEIPIKRINGLKHNYLKENQEEELKLDFNQDIVINGLGFIKIIYSGTVKIYRKVGINVFTRNSLI